MSKRGVNKVILIGHAGRDPEVRQTSGGQTMANLTLATSESWRDKTSGQDQERTEWHRLVFWGRLAEIVEQYVKKGQQVYIEGRLQTRKWQDQSGQDRYTTEVVVNDMQMLGGKDERQEQQRPAQQQKPTADFGDDFMDDDIPF